MKSRLEVKIANEKAKVKAVAELFKAVTVARMSLFSVSKEELALKAGMCTATLYKRLKNPEAFTIGEQVKIATALHTNIVDMYNAQLPQI